MTASSVLLGVRLDQPREEQMAYWCEAHAEAVAWTPGALEHRQHHLRPHNTGLWDVGEEVETDIPPRSRVHGIDEVTFRPAVLPLLALRRAGLIKRAERSVHGRLALHMIGAGGSHRFREAGAKDVAARVVILLRRRPGISSGAFNAFVLDRLAPAIEAVRDVVELRVHALGEKPRHPITEEGAHDVTLEQRFDAAIFLGTADDESLMRMLDAPSLRDVVPDIGADCSVVHTYDVTDTYVYARDGRPTLPQERPERKLPLDPARNEMPAFPDRARRERSEQPFPVARRLLLDGDPEDVVVDDRGRLIGGAGDGRILRVDADSGHQEVIGDTGGRPLGLELLEDGRLLVCDGRKGLLRLDPASGEIETLVRHVDGVPLRFCSNATAASDGTIWFTESTNRFDLEHYFGAFLEHRPSGRLMRRDPDGTVEVVLSDLYFANGVTLTQDERAVILAETAGARISRFDIETRKVEVLAENLPGYPDNLSRMKNGRFWTGLTNPRNRGLDRLGTTPALIRKVLWRIPDRLLPGGRRTVWVMAFDEDGNVLIDLQEPREDFHMVTGVAEQGGRLYLASVEEHGFLVIDLKE